jgi:ferrous iron transport protein B
MVGGQKLTDMIFPLFQLFRNMMARLIPAQSLLYDGFTRSLLLNGIIDGAVMILNYLPIFYVLYLVIAILEDSGYMARIAFIMDRILRTFGLHGQSTLPMLLSGAIVGGCAVPGVMATRTIKDRNARLATILVLPLLNCMAKVPFYVLMTGIFFKNHQALVLTVFSISTFVVALLIAKAFTSTIVRGDPEPFVLELPGYRAPTVQGVFTRGTERLWLFIKKVATIVVAVAVLIWVGVSFPGPRSESRETFETRYEVEEARFYGEVGADYGRFLATPEALTALAQFDENYSVARRSISRESAIQNLNERYIMKNPEFAKIVLKGTIPLREHDIAPFTAYLNSYRRDLSAMNANTLAVQPQELFSRYMRANPYYFALVRTGDVSVKNGRVIDNQAKSISGSWRGFTREVASIKRDMKKATLEGSVLGTIGRVFEPLTSIAGMNWKVNVAIIGSFAAKEALVSTLGTIYSIEGEGVEQDTTSLQAGIEEQGGFRALHALAIMILIAFFPPCIAAMMMIKVETGGVKWMLFAVVYPIILGFIVASLVFQIGLLLGF